ncbi:3335_t:CDS:1, partial [Scutellospora calospora]
MSSKKETRIALVDYNSDNTLPDSNVRFNSSHEILHLINEFNEKKQYLEKIINKHDEHITN